MTTCTRRTLTLAVRAVLLAFAFGAAVTAAVFTVVGWLTCDESAPEQAL